MLTDPKRVVDYLYYNKLPNIYREKDSQIGFPFYRYLSAIFINGAGLALEDMERMINLIDPEHCPEEYLEFFFKSFGLPYYADIDVEYQRKFLANAGELIKRRGTYSCVRYLAKTLTGLDVDLRYLRGYNESGEYGRYLYIDLLAKTVQQASKIDVSTFVIEKYIKFFIPYYITDVVTPVVERVFLERPIYRKSIISVNPQYKIYPFFTSAESNILSSCYRGVTITSSIEQVISST